MILTTSLIAQAAINSLVPSIINGIVNLYTSNKEQDYKNQCLNIEKEKLKLEKLKLQENKLERENFQKQYYDSQKSLAKDMHFLQNAWPLLMPPDYMPIIKNGDKVIMRVILAESNDSDYQKTIGNSVRNKLNSIIAGVFSQFSDHPISFYLDGWKTNFNNGNPSVDALYQILKGQPTLVIIPVVSDNTETLIIRTAFWGFGVNADNPTDIDFMHIPLGRIKRDVCREYAKCWREYKRCLTENQLGLDINPVDEKNLHYLTKEEKLINKDVDFDDLEHKTTIFYNYNTVDPRIYDEVTNYIVAAIESTISLIADIYYQVEYKCKPMTPIILSSLEHPSFLPSVSLQMLPLYNTCQTLICGDEDKDIFINIESMAMHELIDTIIYLMKFSGLNLQKVDARSCAIRLIWDENLSNLLKSWLVVYPDKDMKEQVIEYVNKILYQLDETCSVDSIRNFIQNLSIDVNKNKIVFAIISHHTLIRQYQKFVELASYRLYSLFHCDTEGTNWLMAYNIADCITMKTQNKESKKQNYTPAMFIEHYQNEFKEVVYENLQRFNIKVKPEMLDLCVKDGILLENIRKMTDLLISFDQEEKKQMKLTSSNMNA